MIERSIMDSVDLRVRDNSMSLREYYAGLAMQGTLAADNRFAIKHETIAEWSVDLADKLLAELRKEQL